MRERRHLRKDICNGGGGICDAKPILCAPLIYTRPQFFDMSVAENILNTFKKILKGHVVRFFIIATVREFSPKITSTLKYCLNVSARMSIAVNASQFTIIDGVGT